MEALVCKEDVDVENDQQIIQWLSKFNEFEQSVCENEDDIANQDNSSSNFITSKHKESPRGEATTITYDEILK